MDTRLFELGTLALVFALTGCGGENEFSEDITGDITFTGPAITDQNRSLSISDIAGVWYVQSDIEGTQGEVFAVNEYYLALTESGAYVEYDYMGDSMSAPWGYGNCYLKQNEGVIAKIPTGGFLISVGSNSGVMFSYYTNFELQGVNLLAEGQTFNPDCNCFIPTSLASPSPLTQTDLEAQLCQ